MRAAREGGRASSNKVGGSTKCESPELAQIFEGSIFILSGSFRVLLIGPQPDGTGPQPLQGLQGNFLVESLIVAADGRHALHHAAEGLGDVAGRPLEFDAVLVLQP